MIKYNNGLFGFQLLFRLHGSAVFKSIPPATISCLIYVLLYFTVFYNNDIIDDPILFHPYPMGALISALTFLLTFRANFSYQRYWEAMTTVHAMHSKWMDVGMQLAACHLQSSCYDNKKPPCFGKLIDPQLQTLNRERERTHEPTLQEFEKKLDDIILEQQHQPLTSSSSNTNDASAPSHRESFPFWKKLGRKLRVIRKVNQNCDDIGGGNVDDATSKKSSQCTSFRHQNNPNINDKNSVENSSNTFQNSKRSYSMNDLTMICNSNLNSVRHQPPIKQKMKSINAVSMSMHSEPDTNSQRLSNSIRLSLFGKSSFELKSSKATERMILAPSIVSIDTTEKVWNQKSPPLFLQESAHLLSLLSAVALSTLRNDLEGAESPLITFKPNVPWPHVDPDSYEADIRKGWNKGNNTCITLLRYAFNVSRTPATRTLYNAARPFRVIGGVSDNEIELLQAARGPLAKVTLVFLWLSEFMTRESLHGSMGDVPSPIYQRLYQHLSDGMLAYNHARKIAYIPFPFPHAQITALFTLIVSGFLPMLMLSFVSNFVFGLIMNFVTVICFMGLQEVARELESPFQNVPNDIPLNNFQAQYNESLLTIFAGYHPDAYWEVIDCNYNGSGGRKDERNIPIA